MKKLLVILLAFVGIVAFAGPHHGGHGGRGGHGGPPPHHHHGGGYRNSGLRTAADIVSIVANGVRIVNGITYPPYYSTPVYTEPVVQYTTTPTYVQTTVPATTVQYVPQPVYTQPVVYPQPVYVQPVPVRRRFVLWR